MPDNRLTRWFRKAEAEAGVPPPSEPIRAEDFVGSDQDRNERYVREGFAAKAKGFLTKLPMAEEVASAYFCMLDPATPKWVKGIAAAALAYFVLPVDAIVDAIPFAGLMDDVTVLTGALTAISAFITDEHRARARSWMASEQITPSADPDGVGSEG
ncbi:YkvA family protein [Tautonia sociabilis]|uniref:DUF1232 domain-containing protein n=1 Tax=Tautonia sociabilis TaxID=2080755 RepID=A0A432MNG1_9BACT|nr:YkvA family protein [Tautonia sociabilis]RUL88727.1 DUF1232 domain-containing protein [Tautonia sociabilis]